ncbi:MAG: branched-chain amino acid ABC transporter permease [Planctomycetota bacterium]|nr:branched-chain amino acid ABC transporter permease [Planctomycetota bacterium]
MDAGVLQLPLAIKLDLWLTDQVILVGLFALLALSLNLINGWGRMFSLGHHGFYFLGAYGAAWLTAALPTGLPGALVFVTTCLFGMLVATAGGLLIGVPCLRLRGDYLAIATLGFGEGVRLVISNADVRVPPGFTVPRVLFEVNSSNLLMYRLLFLGIVILLVVGVVLLIRNYVRSSAGRAMLAVAQDERAAGLLGINPTGSKVLVFLMGSAIAGLAGAVYAHYSGSVAPKDFEFVLMVTIFLIVVLGGLGSISGCILAAFLLRATERGLGMVGGVVSEWWQVEFALILILLMIFRPNGIFGPRELTDVIRDWRQRRRAGSKA